MTQANDALFIDEFESQLSDSAESQEVKKTKPVKSIANTIRNELKAGKAPADVLKIVKKKHKACKTTMACVYWYKSRFNRGLEK